MPTYNLIEYSDNYSDISGSLWGFKGDAAKTALANNANVVNNDNASSFKYKENLIGEIEAEQKKE